MTPASRVPAARDAARLLVVSDERAPHAAIAPIHTQLRELPRFLARGDALIVNDAATLPASLHGRTARGEPIELRLLDVGATGRARGVLLGAGDFHTRTEHRPAPPVVRAGEVLAFGESAASAPPSAQLHATVRARAALSPRLLELDFDAQEGALWAALYRHGRPIQYSHHPHALPLYAFQTAYAARPWAMELPSAGRPLSWSVLLELRRRGVHVAALTHAAGLSATGDPAIDAALPLAERFDIPQAAVTAIARARAAGGRVLAAGTSVVRALEGSAQLHGGALRAGAGETEVILDDRFERRVADGLLTGMHEPSESHFRLLRAFAGARTLEHAHAQATAAGYLSHEFGDSMLLLSSRAVPAALPRAASRPAPAP